jgi:hypothetical protein
VEDQRPLALVGEPVPVERVPDAARERDRVAGAGRRLLVVAEQQGRWRADCCRRSPRGRCEDQNRRADRVLSLPWVRWLLCGMLCA